MEDNLTTISQHEDILFSDKNTLYLDCGSTYYNSMHWPRYNQKNQQDQNYIEKKEREDTAKGSK